MAHGAPLCSTSPGPRAGRKPLQVLIAGVIAVSAGLLSEAPLRAQGVGPPERAAGTVAPRRDLNALAEAMNANTVTVVTGSPPLAYAVFGYDLAAVLNNGDELRVLPIVSQGGFQNVRDVRFLKGVDLGFAQTNILGYFRRTGEIGNLDDKLAYITKVCNEEVHFVVKSDITSLEQLRGKKVNFNTAGSGTQLTAHDIFSHLGISVEEVNMRPNDAMEKLKTGEIAATVLTSAKPSPALAGLKSSDGYRILPVPFNNAMAVDYLPSTLTHEDYPDLIAPGQTVETIASGDILFSYNWPRETDRYRRIEKFVNAFFSKFAEFRKPPRHEKWRDTNLATIVPGWNRFPAAEEWLQNNRQTLATNSREQFDQFLAQYREVGSVGALSEADRQKLFSDFLTWSRSRP
jgi:uncharacterized protein